MIHCLREHLREEARSTAHRLSPSNQKGGVAKTTNTAHIAAALGKLGRRVLVWDLDVNYGLTSHFGIPPMAYSGTFHVLTGEREPEDSSRLHNLPVQISMYPGILVS